VYLKNNIMHAFNTKTKQPSVKTNIKQLIKFIISLTIARNTDRRVVVQNGTFSSIAEDTKVYPSAFIKAYRKNLAQAK
jgi:hypothetical protein